jgi:hypothetical protein
MNATLAHMVEDALFVVLQVCRLIALVKGVADCFLVGISDAYYCAECTRLEKDRDGCPKIVNLGASRTDLFYERRRLGESLNLPVHLLITNHSVPRLQERIDSQHGFNW